MVRSWRDEIYFFVRILDLVVGVTALALAYFLRFEYLRSSDGYHGLVETFGWLIAATLVLHAIVYPYFGFYASLRLRELREIFLMVFKAAATELFILGSLVFFIQAKDTSRYFFGLYVIINYSLILLTRIVARIGLSVVRQRGYNYRQILILGHGQAAAQVLRAIVNNRHWGYLPVGILTDPSDPDAPKDVLGVPVVGQINELESILDCRTVDEIVIAEERLDRKLLAEYIELCETRGIPIRVTFGEFGLDNLRVAFSNLDGIPMIVYFNTSLMTFSQAMVKRTIDISVSLMGLGVTALLYPWISYRIRKESPGPVIFKQVRVGQNGRKFKCYKFRTMSLDADSRRGELTHCNLMEGPMFKVSKDPRVFRFGSFLRSTSLDELPQFINILRGDMSLVGTRPPTPDEVEQYLPHYRRRLSIRPGLTGLWQVNGRNQISKFNDVLAYDLRYIDNWSILLDLQIIFRTVFTLLHRRGAC